MPDQKARQAKDEDFDQIPLYAIVRDAVKKSADQDGNAILEVAIAAVISQLAEDQKCPDLHDSIMTVIAFHEDRKHMNMAELIGVLECIKQRLFDIAKDRAAMAAATERG